MLATIESVLILDNAEKIAEMINQSEIAVYYKTCLDKLRKNAETQKKIQNFLQMKEKYEDVQRFGKYHPDFKKVMKEVREVKREMDLDEHVAEFRKAENDFQDLLDEVSMITLKCQREILSLTVFQIAAAEAVEPVVNAVVLHRKAERSHFPPA